MLGTLRERLSGLGVTVEFDASAVTAVAKAGFDAVYGARPLRRAIQSNIEDMLSEKLLDGSLKSGDSVVCRYRDGQYLTE